jgi:hypothetical protein
MSTLGSDIAIFEAIASSLKGALNTYNEKYSEFYQDFRLSRSKSGGINIDEYIGEEVELSELQKYKA